MIVVYLIIVILVLCAFATMGRKGHRALIGLSKWAYAHRGLHGDGIPENSLKAFRRAVAEGYGAELDVHLLKDGKLAVIHDSSLKRTTGVKGLVENLTTADLQNYFLEGTFENIPEFSQVLEIFEGKAPIIVELKSKGDNVDALCRAACKYLDNYPSFYCIESFDPRCVQWFRKHRPNVLRGQLAENFFKTKKCKLSLFLKFVMANHLSNFLTYPDFIAYRYSDRNTLMTRLCRKLWNVASVSWTVTNQQEYDTAVKEGWIPIFEDFMP